MRRGARGRAIVGMRRPWLLLASVVLVDSLAGCDALHHPSPGGPADAGSDLVDGAPAIDAATLPPTSASFWLTTADGVTLLQQQADVAFASAGAGDGPTIVVDDDVRFQEIDGFGASLTESSAYVLANHMTAAARTALLRRLFDRDSGIALRVLRQPIGASDFALGNYSYDDTPPDLSDFSIAHDRATIIPILKEIRAINPDLLIIASPWSPPGWMKTSGSMLSGELAATQYRTLADYFVKFVRAYTDEGLPIYAVTPQNEPHFVSGSYPGMRMDAVDQARFVGEELGPALAAAGLGTTKILVWDHNWDEPQ